MTTRLKKRCARCGWAGLARSRQRHCHQPRFGRGSYACWGDLTIIPKKERAGGRFAAVPTPPGVGIGWQLTDAAEAARMTEYRARAERERDKARAKVAEKARQLRVLSTNLAMWERRASLWAKRAAMTDAEIAAERAKRQAAHAKGRAARSRRGMRLTS